MRYPSATRMLRIMGMTYLILSILAAALGTQKDQPSLSRGKGVSIVPHDIRLSLELNSPISTHKNKKGDKFTCLILSPEEFKDAVVVGRIGKIKSSGRASGRAEFGLIFESIRLADGTTSRFDAQVIQIDGLAIVTRNIQTDEGIAEDKTTANLEIDSEGTIKAPSLRLRDAATIAGTTAAGTAIGYGKGGGKGAAEGAAVGLGVGILASLLTKGPDVVLGAGTKFYVLSGGRGNSKKPL
ncbi:MAG: hypothetical protein V7641_4550 [Blastocatellia bacterium]